MSPQAWTAVWATTALVFALALLCFGPPAWEAVRASQYRRETDRIEGRVPVGDWRPVSLGASMVAELVVRVSFWVVAKVLRLDREAAHRG